MKEPEKKAPPKMEPWSEDPEMTPEIIAEAEKMHKAAEERELAVREKFNRENPDWCD